MTLVSFTKALTNSLTNVFATSELSGCHVRRLRGGISGRGGLIRHMCLVRRRRTIGSGGVGATRREVTSLRGRRGGREGVWCGRWGGGVLGGTIFGGDIRGVCSSYSQLYCRRYGTHFKQS